MNLRLPMMHADSSAQSSAAETAALYRLGAIGAALVAFTLLTPFAFRAAGDNAYIALALAAGLLTIAAARTAESAPITQALWLILGVAIALRGFLLLFDPLLSSDIYRYIWDGKVQAAGINPYRYYPAHEALVPLRDAAIYPNINRADYAVTIYPPGAEFFFLIVTRLGESVTVMRLALLGCEAGLVVIVLLLLRRTGRSPARVVAYAWHPLPMWEIANNGHIDVLMMALMMLGLWLAFTQRQLRGAIAIALGTLVKPFAVLAFPAIWRPWDWRVPCLVLVVWVLCYAPYLPIGSGVFGFLFSGYLTEERIASGEGLWPLAAWRLIFGVHRGDVILYFAVASLIVGGIALVAARRVPRSIELSVADINRLLLVFLFFLSPNYPWYFLAVTPFVVLCGGAPAWTASIGALLLQEEVDWDFYVPLLVRKSVLYGAFLLACAHSVWLMRRKRTADGESRA